MLRDVHRIKRIKAPDLQAPPPKEDVCRCMLGLEINMCCISIGKEIMSNTSRTCCCLFPYCVCAFFTARFLSIRLLPYLGKTCASKSPCAARSSRAWLGHMAFKSTHISAARLCFERNMHCLECFSASATGSNKERCISFVWCCQVCIYLTPLPHSRVFCIKH